MQDKYIAAEKKSFTCLLKFIILRYGKNNSSGEEKMKKFFATFFLIAIQALAQNRIPQGSGYTYTITIKYGNSAISDSVENVDLGLQHGDLTSIYVEGNNNGSDSVMVRAGTKSYLVPGLTASDTIWGSYVPLKDSSGAVVNVIVNNTTGKHYWINEPNQDILQFQLKDYRDALLSLFL